jgi:hypothetical protein
MQTERVLYKHVQPRGKHVDFHKTIKLLYTIKEFYKMLALLYTIKEV